jgi:hypothetical protein
MKGSIRLLMLSLPLLGLAAGCGSDPEKVAQARTEAGVQQGAPQPEGAPAKVENKVVVPAGQNGKWKAVRISVLAKDAGKQAKPVLQEVPLGADTAIPGTGLTIRVDAVLPDFSMGGGVITSKSDSPNNPAAQVQVAEGAKPVFKGWMFSLFPEAHAFEHPKYAIKLVELVPAS